MHRHRRISTPGSLAACLSILTFGMPWTLCHAAESPRPHAPVSRRATLPDLPPNPIVQSMLAAVSTDELRASLQALQDCHTRNTASDTVSAAVGIGAARRWIHDRLQDFAQLPGSNLTAGYFDFTATICAVNRLNRNVLATIPGTLSPERNFLVCAHMDSRTIGSCDPTSFAPGANDDGSGTAVALEMARILSTVDLESSMILMAVTGEEQGLYGSTAYAQWAVAQNMRIDGMITNDTVGNITGCVDPACPDTSQMITDSTSVRHFSLGPSTSIHRQLTRAMKLNAERYLDDFTVNLIPARDRPGRSGDHFPFDTRGYAAARLTEPHEFGDGSGSNGRQHNQYDLIDHVYFPYLARITKINLALFANLALAPETPESPDVEPLGGGALRLGWRSVTTAPDVAGYRVALRGAHLDSLHYFDILDAGLDPGGNQEFIVSGLTPDVPVYVSVSAYDLDHNESIFSPEVMVTPQAGEIRGGDHRSDTQGTVLRSLTPNPAIHEVEITFHLGAPGHVALEVIDIRGRLQALPVSHAFTGGPGRIRWDGQGADGRPVPSGAYLVRLMVDGRVADVKRLIQLR